jgi:archaellum component FlaC
MVKLFRNKKREQLESEISSLNQNVETLKNILESIKNELKNQRSDIKDMQLVLNTTNDRKSIVDEWLYGTKKEETK